MKFLGIFSTMIVREMGIDFGLRSGPEASPMHNVPIDSKPVMFHA